MVWRFNFYPYSKFESTILIIIFIEVLRIEDSILLGWINKGIMRELGGNT